MFRFRIPFIDSQIVAGGAGEGIMTITSAMSLKVNRVNKRSITLREWCLEMRNFILRGDRQDYGVVSRKMVTTIGVRMLADLIADDTNSILGAVPTPGALVAHYWGTGSADPAVGDTFATLELAAPTNAADAGEAGTSVSETSSTNATYTSVATITSGGALAITEHGIGHVKGDGATTLLFDRHLFSAINVISDDSIRFTYVLTINSGG